MILSYLPACGGNLGNHVNLCFPPQDYGKDMYMGEDNDNLQDFKDFAKREIIAFAKAHANEDTARLLLSAARYPGIDMPAAVQQIEGLRTAAEKWPSLVEHEAYLYPPRLNREQASSEATARYKASLLHGTSVADLTGGMGVDTMAFARAADKVDYVERDPRLCSFMKHNANALGLANIVVHQADCIEWLAGCEENSFDTLYIDPARRSASGRRVAAFEDCTPDILQHMPLLRSHCKRLIVKASPMIDIDLACRQLGQVAEVHVVSLRGECKEVLFLCGGTVADTVIHCVSIDGAQMPDFVFTRAEENAAAVDYCTAVGRYLFEPDASLMKGGPYRLIGERWRLAKLAPNTHLYTSDHMPNDFQGRRFEVVQEIKLDRKSLSVSIPQHKAHVITRNYPDEAAVLQRRLGLTEGGDMFVIATTLGTRKTGFLCRSIKR